MIERDFFEDLFVLEMANNHLGSVQRGVNVASNGDTVNASAGTFTEQVNINKGITLSGQGDSTVIKSPAILSPEFTTGDRKSVV